MFIGIRFYGVTCDQISGCQAINVRFLQRFPLFSCSMHLTCPYDYLRLSMTDIKLMLSVHHVITHHVMDKRRGTRSDTVLFSSKIAHMLINWWCTFVEAHLDIFFSSIAVMHLKGFFFDCKF